VPAIPVRLLALGDETGSIMGLIDSGSDCACFPVDLAPSLGIVLGDCVEREGQSAGGKNRQFWWPPGVNAEIAGVGVLLTGVFTDTPFALLGRQDFFRAFSVTFDERAASFELTQYGDDFAATLLASTEEDRVDTPAVIGGT
jgi:hypothetical protein